jgi:hypothetical protein
MLGPVVREALVTHLVGLFDSFDLLHKVVEGRCVRVEDHDHPTEHGVHLGPVHSFDRVQRRLEVLDQSVVTWPVHCPDLDVGPTLAHPHPSMPTSGVQPLERVAGYSADRPGGT